MTMHAWYVDEHQLTILGDLPEPVRRALCEWIEFHGGNPHDIPQRSTIRRLVDRCAVEVTVFVRDSAGHPVLHEDRTGLATRTVLLQGETPPLPWPAIVLSASAGHADVRLLCEDTPDRPPACTEHPDCPAADHFVCCAGNVPPPPARRTPLPDPVIPTT